MVHLMEDASELESDKRVEMIMNGREGDKYHIQIATSERTFRRIVSAADEVAKEQLSLFEYWMYLSPRKGEKGDFRTNLLW
ncbi:FIG00749683: hypothetical protein [Limosilactobacillus reuteri]|uniref:Uncharacterized protein n=2 Tax=Limosilactobacillus reuteri TaxID=1598 RepID=A0A0U5K734_LIMRT|nr:FIG00749683: hypothetical protein [Limosilactobacillus reuteri]